MYIHYRCVTPSLINIRLSFIFNRNIKSGTDYYLRTVYTDKTKRIARDNLTVLFDKLFLPTDTRSSAIRGESKNRYANRAVSELAAIAWNIARRPHSGTTRSEMIVSRFSCADFAKNHRGARFKKKPGRDKGGNKEGSKKIRGTRGMADKSGITDRDSSCRVGGGINSGLNRAVAIAGINNFVRLCQKITGGRGRE